MHQVFREDSEHPRSWIVDNYVREWVRYNDWVRRGLIGVRGARRGRRRLGVLSLAPL
jgi:hypothetical protein